MKHRMHIPLTTTPPDAGSLLIFLYFLTVVLLVLFGWLENAQAFLTKGPVSLDEIRQGELLVPGMQPGQYNRAPRLSMTVDISISGIVARTSVKQRFQNRSADWVEALYVFPLPEGPCNAVKAPDANVRSTLLSASIRSSPI